MLRGQWIRNGQIDRQLRARLIEVGLRDVVIFAEPVIFDDLARAETLLNLATTAHAASEAGMISVSDVEA